MPHPHAAAMEARTKLLHENYLRVMAGGQPQDPPQPTVTVTPNTAVPVSDPAPVAEPQPAAQPVVEPQPPAPPEVDPAREAEMAALREQLDRANAAAVETNKRLQAEIAARQTAETAAQTLRQQQEDAAAAVISDERVHQEFTPEEIESLGGMEQCRAIIKVAEKTARARARTASEAASAKTEAEFQSKLSEVDRQREGLFFMMLETAVPDWKPINKDQRWKDWLQVVDPIARQKRQDLLNRARAVYDAAAVIDMFNAFKATLPPAAGKTAATGVLPTGRAPNGAPGPAQPKGEIITRSWIKEQTRLYSQGKISREAWRTIEAKINSAAVEGRIANQ